VALWKQKQALQVAIVAAHTFPQNSFLFGQSVATMQKFND
jgi:hypothetical protein